MHHQLVASALAVRMAHEIDPENKLGCMLAYHNGYPYTCHPKDVFFAQQYGQIHKSTTPVQALKHCARLLRHRSQHLPFSLAPARLKAGYENFFVSIFTYNRISSFIHPVLYFEIISYTHFLGSLHNLLSHLHFHAHLPLLHNILMTKNSLPIIFSSLQGILQILLVQ